MKTYASLVANPTRKGKRVIGLAAIKIVEDGFIIGVLGSPEGQERPLNSYVISVHLNKS